MSEIIKGMEETWAAFRLYHEDLPAAQITVIASGGADDGARARRNRNLYHVMVSQDRLAVGASLTFQTLIHHAVHAVATARQITDVSGGTYHNLAFVDLAREFGLVVAPSRDLSYGYHTMIVPRPVSRQYAPEIKELARLLKGFRAQPAPVARPHRRDQLRVVCDCDPPRAFRIAESSLNLGPIRCEICGGLFHLPE